MKKLLNLMTLMALIVVTGCNNDPDALSPDDVFIKFYGGNSISKAADFVVRPDGGYVLFGSTNSTSLTSSGTFDFYVLFVDAAGNQEGEPLIIDRYVRGLANPFEEDPVDTTTVKLETTEVASRIKATTEGYVLVGSSSYTFEIEEGVNVTQSDIFIATISSSGDLLQTNAIGEKTNTLVTTVAGATVTNVAASNEVGVDIQEIAEGYILVGSTNKRQSPNPGDEYVEKGTENYLIKLNEELEILNERVYGFPGEDMPSAVEVDGNYFITIGSTQQNSSSGPSDVAFIRWSLNDLGVDLFANFGDELANVPARVKRIGNGDYYLAGNSTTTANVATAFIMRITAGALTEFAHVSYDVDGTATPIPGIIINDVVRLPGSDYLLVGEKLPVNDITRGIEMLMTRVGPTGQLNKSFGDNEEGNENPKELVNDIDIGEVFGGRSDDRAVAVHQLNDGSLVMFGTVDINGNGNTYMGLIKTNPNGILGK